MEKETSIEKTRVVIILGEEPDLQHQKRLETGALEIMESLALSVAKIHELEGELKFAVKREGTGHVVHLSFKGAQMSKDISSSVIDGYCNWGAGLSFLRDRQFHIFIESLKNEEFKN